MSADAKITALLRSVEIEEKQLIKERLPVLEVVEERQKLFDDLENRSDALREKLAEGNRKLRDNSLRSGQVGALAEWERFAKRLKRELEDLAPELESAQAELLKARQRLEAIEEDLVKLKLERRRIEKILENREARERIQSQAIDEASSDDLSVFKNRK